MTSGETERRFIGCMLVDPVMTLHIAKKHGVNSDWFTDSLCRNAWDLVNKMKIELVDALSLANEARKRNIDELDTVFLSNCVAESPTPTYAQHWVMEMRRDYLRRKIKQISMISSQSADDPDVDPDILAAETQMMLNNAVSDVEESKSIEQIYEKIISKWESSNVSKSVGLPTVWPGLQKYIGGYRRGKVYIFGARPGAGKSTFMMNEAYNLSRLGHHVSIASLEMDESELRGRILATDADKSSFGLDTGMYSNCDYQELRLLGKKHAKVPLRINDNANMTIDKLVAWMNYEVIKHHAEFIAIDYLQIIAGSGKRESRNMEITGYMAKICSAAKSISVPTLVLSQLSRSSPHEKRPPDLHDLRDSGSIEQDAYAVIFIHHGIDECDEESFEKSEFIVAKNRGGPTGVVPVSFVRNRQKFIEK